MPGEKPQTNKLNPHMTPDLGIEPGPHWWEASALTTAPFLLSCAILFILRLVQVVHQLSRNIISTYGVAFLKNIRQIDVGGAVASWLVRSAPVRALAGDIVFCSCPYSHGAPPPPPSSTQVYKWDGLASHPGWSRNTPSRFMLQKPR